MYSILLGTIGLLTIPVIIQLTVGTGIDGQGFNWTLGDFAIVGALLFGLGLLCEFILRKIKTKVTAYLLCSAVFLLLLLVFIDLAVGIFNIPGFSGS